MYFIHTTGNNYLTWAMDAEMYLAAEENGDVIKEGNNASEQLKAKGLIFLVTPTLDYFIYLIV